MKNHPLFTLELDLDDPEYKERSQIDVGALHVFRQVNGRWVLAGRQYTAEEMCSVEAMQATFGGGEYEVRGRPPDNSGICMRARIALPGPPRIDPPVGMPESVPQALHPTSSAGFMGLDPSQLQALIMRALNPPPAGGSDSAVLVALIQNMGTMMTGTMQMIGNQSSQNLAAQVELVKALQQQPQGGNNPAAVQDSFMRGIQAMSQIAREMKGTEGEPGKPFSWDTVLEVANRVMQTVSEGHQMIKTVNGIGDGSPTAEVVAANLPAPPVANPAQAA